MASSLKATLATRKAVLAGLALLAGGGAVAMYAVSQPPRQRRRGNRDGGDAAGKKGEGEGSAEQDLQVVVAQKRAGGKGKGRRGGGIKSVQYLGSLVLANMGSRGMSSLLMLAGMAVVRTALSNRLARVQGYLFRAAFLKRVPLFVRLISENLALCLAQSFLVSTTKFFTGKLFLVWRQVLTDRVHADYFENMAYYKLSHVDGRIPNPEQRISSDLPKFCKELSDLLLDNLNAICDVGFYTYSLCSYASPKYALGILAYVLGAGTITTTLSPPFGKLMSKEQSLEGEYRSLHSRLVTHAEGVAFYGGQEREASIVLSRFRDLVGHHRRVLHTQWWFGMIQDFLLKYCGATWGVVLIIGPFFSGALRPSDSTDGRAEMLSNMRYHTSVVINLFQAMGTLAGSTRRLLRLSGYAERIAELMSVTRELRLGSGPGGARGGGATPQGVFREAPQIAFEGVKVVTPTGSTLVEDLNLVVEPGCNLLITGPNGSGKSSLFRVLGGLWPLVAGRIAKPGSADLGHEIFYVPQRPYTALGTLRDQLVYPRTAVDGLELLSREEMRDLLKIVDLDYLIDRYPEDQEVNWGEELSLGEQQRLGMARLFYHKPKFAILDECTSAVTTDMEERFCARVRQMGTTCVTISHRPALVAFHDTVLALDGEGGWSVHYKKDLQGGTGGAALSGGSAAAGGEDVKAVVTKGSVARRADSQTVTNSFLQAGSKAGSKGGSVTDMESYVGAVIAASPVVRDATALQIPVVPTLDVRPESMGKRVERLMRVLMPTYFNKQGFSLTLLAALVVGRTWLSDRIASLNGRSVKNVLEQDRVGFLRLIGVSVLQSAASAIVAPTLRHLTASLALAWRASLTRKLTSLYFKSNAFYKVVHLCSSKVDADHRLTQDVEKLCSDLAGLITGLVKPTVDVVWFTWRMKTLTGNRGVAILYTYMLLGLGFLRLITPNFGALNSQEQALEGSFRFLHSRLRAHAESIAFFGGGGRERAVLGGRFAALMAHARRLHAARWAFGIADEFVTKQLPHNVTWVVSLLYALEQPGDRADTQVQGKLAHDLRFLASVVSQSFLAFGDILELYRKFLEIGGSVVRVSELQNLLEDAQGALQGPQGLGRTGSMVSLVAAEDGRPGAARGAKAAAAAAGAGGAAAASNAIVFDQVDVVTPGHKMLARKLSMEIQPSKSLLVTGPNGSGKTSLFRVLGGLWPLVSGHIIMPGLLPGGAEDAASTGLHSRDIFYVPQRPYTALGTLRDQIVYPLTAEEAALKVLQESSEITEVASVSGGGGGGGGSGGGAGGGRGGLVEAAADGEDAGIKKAVVGAGAMRALERRLRAILEDVRLLYLLEREGGWEANANWEDMLSLGEQQRLGMARLFFHRPKFGILDECTNATSVDVEEGLYRRAQALGITFVTISQRPALIPFHSVELRLIDGEGSWELRSIKRTE